MVATMLIVCKEMKLLKSFFIGFLTVVFATSGAFAKSDCFDSVYRRAHPVECGDKEYRANNNNTLLALVGGAALIGVGIALASHTSGHAGSSSVISNQSSFPRVALSSNIDTNYAPNDIVVNRRISGVYGLDFSKNENHVSESAINAVKSLSEYQRNYKQYDAINFAVARARGFTGKNANIVVVDNFYGVHGHAVHEIAHNIASDSHITDINIATSEYGFASFDSIANMIGNSSPADVYNASWQADFGNNSNINAATVVYDNQGYAKTYSEVQSYMYGVVGQNLINRVRNIASDNDAIFVWSAGNKGESESGALSAMPLVFPDLDGHFVNVVALDNYGELAWYSNQCGITQNYCIAAPGSAWNTDAKDFASGTSFAAPVVSGAIAVIKEAFPYMSANEITNLLFTTATDLGEAGVDSVYGWGALNMEKATKPVGTPRIVLSNENIQPLNNINVSGAVAGAIKSANVQIAFVDDFGRAFTTKLSDNIHVIPHGRGFDKLRESENDSVVLFNNFEFGVKQNNLLESYGLMSAKSNKLTNFVGYKNEFNIDTLRFYQNARVGITNPTADTDSLVSGFSNIYTMSAKTGVQWKDLSLEIAIPDTIVSGDMCLNVPVARANNGQMVYSDIDIDLASRPSVEYTAKYKFLSATYVNNPMYQNEFFIMAKTKLAF